MRKKLSRIREAAPWIAILAFFLCFHAPSFAQVAEIVFSAPWGEGEGEIGLINQPETEICGPLSFCTDNDSVFLLDSAHEKLIGVGVMGKARTVAGKIAGDSLCADGEGGAFVQTEDRILHINSKGEKKGNFKINVKANPGKSSKLIQGYGNEMFVDHKGQACLRTANQKIHKFSGAKNVKRLASIPNASLDFQIKRMPGNEVRIIGFQDDGESRISVTVRIDGGEAGSALYKGMDNKGNLYVEVENIKDDKVFLEVHRYAQTGERLAVFELSNNYFTTVYKKTEVAPDGSVYQMLTTEKGVQILRYGKEG
ncbi:hypothetical protein JW926_03285 [Candidatus Sumerlaeota bacterium]|nr:hypothetical protein [Candidatus Sumerlaeota bacterium]